MQSFWSSVGTFFANLVFKLLVVLGAFQAGRNAAESDQNEKERDALQEEVERLNDRPRNHADRVGRLQAWRDKLPKRDS